MLSGHGSVEVGGGETTVPGGFELVVLAPPGACISDRLGGLIERGEKVKKLKLPTGASGMIDFKPITYPAGKRAPICRMRPSVPLTPPEGGEDTARMRKFPDARGWWWPSPDLSAGRGLA